jgi:hypothetical protein
MSTYRTPERPPVIDLVPIETRSKTKMFRVDYNGCPIGLVEKMPDDRCTRNPWKSRLGIGTRQTFLGVIYAARPGKGFQALAKQIAVDAVIAAHEGIDVSGDAFEKAYGADAVIPAWKASHNANDFTFGGRAQ